MKAWLVGTLSEEVLGLVVGLKTSHEVWEALWNAFAQDSQARKFELGTKLSKMEEKGRSINEYPREFKKVCDELNAIGKPMDDKAKVFHLLTGLGPEYKMFRTTMLRLPLPSFKELLPMLKGHEVIDGDEKSEISSNTSMAFYSQNHGDQKGKSFKPPSKKKGGYFTSKIK